MLATRSGSDWVVRAPAKLNLSFEILARRVDGFHEIETLMVSVGLYDSLSLRSTSTGEVNPSEVTVEWIPAFDRQATASSKAIRPHVEPADVPACRDNLAVRAVERLRQRAGLASGAIMRLVKRIPSAAGLGGGSSNAAAALLAANAAWDLNWSRGQLAAVAAEIGSDVPFFLSGGAAICRGRGEQIQPVAIGGPLHFVIVRPPVGLSTPRVYAACRPAHEAGRTERLLAALQRGNLSAAGKLFSNRLEPAAETLTPWIERLRSEFGRFDCLGHQMSGSGSSYFGLCRHARQARQMAGCLRSRGLGATYAVASCRTRLN